MVNKVGVWIDKRQAVVATFTNDREACTHIPSDMESQERRAGDRADGPFESLNVPSDDVRDHKETAELNKYYDHVISHLKDAKAIFLCGPGETKKHLASRIEKNGHVCDNVIVEAADHMTDAQFVAKARQHFHIH